MYIGVRREEVSGRHAEDLACAGKSESNVIGGRATREKMKEGQWAWGVREKRVVDRAKERPAGQQSQYAWACSAPGLLVCGLGLVAWAIGLVAWASSWAIWVKI